MSRKRGKKKTAEQIAADLIARRGQDLAAVGLSAEVAALPRHDDIEVTREGQYREGQRAANDSARRLDAFAALKEGMEKGAYDAARRLERDIAISLDEHDRGRSLSRVDNDKRGDRTDDIVAASRRVDAVLLLLGTRDQWLLRWLIRPPANRFNGWRDIVAHITGETDRLCQGAAVRLACGALRDAYDQNEAKGRVQAA